MTAPAAVLALLALEPPGACPAPAAAAGPGGPAPVHVPSRAAFDLNREGRDLYRARRFEAARARYRAAAEADPAFLAPLLNVATSYALEERPGEAVAEALALARRAYVPWARAIRQAADLAPLRPRPAWRALEAGLEEAGRAWGAALAGALFFVARTEAPLRIPAEPGVFVLDPKQEIFAWQPRTGRYLAVTAEDGRVLAAVTAPDGRRVAYARGEKLVREDPAGPPRLRGLAVLTLDIASMAAGPPAALEGDVEWLELSWPAGVAHPLVRAQRAGAIETAWLRDGILTPTPAPPRRGRRADPDVVRLTGQGVRPGFTERRAAPCPFAAADRPALRIEVTSRVAGRHALAAPHGAGLRGLPFP